MIKGLIFGILGMDGSHMADLLHSKGYFVYGVVKKGTDPKRIEEMKMRLPGILIFKTDVTNREELELLINKIQPDEVYNFAAVSDVIDPYFNVGVTMEINGRLPAIIMYILSGLVPHAKFFQASSSLIFGNRHGGTIHELVAKEPTIPYGAAKLSADKEVDAFRKKGLFACSGIFFNHESERRAEHFFTRKVSKGIAEIHAGKRNYIKFGNLSDFRDIGYAPEYMEAAWMMLQNPVPRDYVIGTGNAISMLSYVSMAFAQYNVPETCIVLDPELVRPYEEPQRANIAKIKDELGWEPKVTYPEIIKKMVDHDIALLQKQTA